MSSSNRQLSGWKFLSLIVLVAMVMSLAACAPTATPAPTPAAAQPTGRRRGCGKTD